jgi:hypothetical protein
MRATGRGRAATTLIEVLVAIFVMAIGLLTLLTLFPLGALSMGQAIKDDRCATAAANAAAIAEAHNVRQDPLVTMAFANPFQGTNLTPRSVQSLTPDPNGPSYAVVVDPLGVQLGARRLGSTSATYEGQTYPGIPRVAVSFATSPKAIARWFSLLDDLTFPGDGSSGTPVVVGNLVERANQYSWSYLLRRPRSSNPSVVDLTVLVYSGRPSQLPLGEYTFGRIAFDLNSNFVDIPAVAPGTTDKVPVRKGSWILDASMVAPSGPGRQPPVCQPHGYFYRVVGVSDTSAGLRLELQSPPKASTIAPGGQPYGVLVVMENVVEVFEKGPGWQP